MPHQTSSTRNDYERKINYGWPHKELPSWLTRAHTQLLPKNENAHLAKNYHPVTCQNLMFKLCTSCINTSVQEHYEINNIVITEQVGGVAKC